MFLKDTNIPYSFIKTGNQLEGRNPNKCPCGQNVHMEEKVGRTWCSNTFVCVVASQQEQIQCNIIHGICYLCFEVADVNNIIGGNEDRS